jgi:starch-binding outer membrane protein, SusD/RagB family
MDSNRRLNKYANPEEGAMRDGARRRAKRGVLPWQAGSFATLLALILTVAACDFDVINPGPVQDEFLNDPAAHRAVVTGAERGVTQSLRMNSFITAEVGREFTEVGTSSVPRLPTLSGDLSIATGGSTWNITAQSIWVADDAIRRLREALGGEFDSHELGAEVMVWAGYANRIAGENMCDCVIEGSEPQPHTVYLTRARDYFTDAIAIANQAGRADLALAARAGRAAVHVHLGNWSDAVADADGVPDAFVFQAQFFWPTEENRIANSNGTAIVGPSSTGRTWSVYNTFFEEYYPDTGDPRTPWDTHPDFEFGDTSIRGQFLPWWFGTKYRAADANINLASGREMRLIEAEALLRDGQWPEAMGLVNGIRTSVISDVTGQPLEAWEANNAEEAWTFLKLERRLELWLEGRRLGDLRRWIIEGAPGELQADEQMTGRYLCFPIGNGERDTNPNVPEDPEVFHFEWPSGWF